MAFGTWDIYSDFLYEQSIGNHQWWNHQYKLALTDESYNSGDTVIGDITQISEGVGYITGGVILSTYSEQVSSDALYKGGTAVWLATGLFRAYYCVLYNSSNNKLVGHARLVVDAYHEVNAGEYFNVNLSKNGVMLFDNWT